MRTSAFITPVTAIASQQASANAENRGTTVASADARSELRDAAVPSTAARPPTHSAAARTCSTRLSVARSCAPPAEEWPVNATGNGPASASANSTTDQPQVSTVRHPMSTMAAITAVNTQDVGSASLGAIRTSSPGERTSDTERPSASATLNGTIRTAACRPADRGPRRHAQGPVARAVEVAVALRGCEERGQEHAADRQHHAHLGDRADRGQADGRQRARIGEAQRGDRARPGEHGEAPRHDGRDGRADREKPRHRRPGRDGRGGGVWLDGRVRHTARLAPRAEAAFAHRHAAAPDPATTRARGRPPPHRRRSLLHRRRAHRRGRRRCR